MPSFLENGDQLIYIISTNLYFFPIKTICHFWKSFLFQKHHLSQNLYCLNYTLLLLHLFMTHLVTDLEIYFLIFFLEVFSATVFFYILDRSLFSSVVFTKHDFLCHDCTIFSEFLTINRLWLPGIVFCLEKGECILSKFRKNYCKY